MIRHLQTVTLIVTVFTAAGCVQTRPLLSHAHIGHALTTWHDTPGQEGLFTVATKELDIAIDATNQALFTVRDPDRARRHLQDALHALNPDRQRIGKGLDYGAIRALTGAVEHLEYAANSNDASDNFVSSVVTLADQGDLVVARLVKAQTLIEEIDMQDPANDPRLMAVRQTLTAAKYGEQEGGAAAGSLARNNWGLVHIAAQLGDMLEREADPAYEPVPRKYVLGLVRLPSGLWGYRLARPDYGAAGYGYGY